MQTLRLMDKYLSLSMTKNSDLIKFYVRKEDERNSYFFGTTLESLY